MDELEDYLSNGVFSSSVGHYMVAIGEKPSKKAMRFDDIGPSDIKLHGLLFVWPDDWEHYVNQWDNFEHSTPERLEAMYRFAASNDVPLLWVNEAGVDWRRTAGAVSVGQVVKRPPGYAVDPDDVPANKFSSYLQEFFGTELGNPGTGKKASKTIPLQAWGREHLPGDYLTLDFDLLVTDGNGVPVGLGEVKRTDQSIHSWAPYEFPDKLNYYLQALVCEGLGATPFIIKHQKCSVTDDGDVKYYEYHCDKSTTDWLDIDVEERISGAELRRRLQSLDNL